MRRVKHDRTAEHADVAVRYERRNYRLSRTSEMGSAPGKSAAASFQPELAFGITDEFERAIGNLDFHAAARKMSVLYGFVDERLELLQVEHLFMLCERAVLRSDAKNFHGRAEPNSMPDAVEHF